MILFLILITFFAFSVGAQDSKPRFWGNFHIDLNGNLSNTSNFYEI